MPTIMFFMNGKEIPESRITGYMNSDEFIEHVKGLKSLK